MVLLPIQEVQVGSQNVLFWDNGSTATLCTYQLAEKLGHRGTPVTYIMQTVDIQGRVQKKGMVNTLIITTNEGADHIISAYSVESIASCPQLIDIDQSLMNLIPGLNLVVWVRPKGDLGLSLTSCPRVVMR